MGIISEDTGTVCTTNRSSCISSATLRARHNFGGLLSQNCLVECMPCGRTYFSGVHVFQENILREYLS